MMRCRPQLLAIAALFCVVFIGCRAAPIVDDADVPSDRPSLDDVREMDAHDAMNGDVSMDTMLPDRVMLADTQPTADVLDASTTDGTSATDVLIYRDVAWPDCSRGDAASDASTGDSGPSGTCPDGQTLCGRPATCVSTATNAEHCGSCFNPCNSTYEGCVAGRCECNAGRTRCGALCMDTMNDPRNCGGCGVSCGDGPCVGGVCSCVAPMQMCNGVCVDTRASVDHCGACGTTCPTGSLCVGGTCTTACSGPNHRMCSGVCADLRNDPQNCGACARGCYGSCVQGRCYANGVQCDPTPSVFGTECQHLADALSCGRRATVCDSYMRCDRGDCRCAEGARVGFSCVDLNTDPFCCGPACDACPVGGRCAAGRCECPSGTTRCGQRCVDLQTTQEHCGACGNACALGQSCIHGECRGGCDAPLLSCDCECVDPRTDWRHCGGCRQACPVGTACVDGGCVPGCRIDEDCNERRWPGSCAFGTVVPNCRGETPTTLGTCERGPVIASCSGLIREPLCDTRNRTHNDGCGARQLCIEGTDGACRPPCVDGQVECDGFCWDLRTTNRHCGRCGYRCPDGRECRGGLCS